MPILPESTKNIRLPRMYPVTQNFPDVKTGDLTEATKAALMRDEIKDLIPEGASVALLVGSRGITGLREVVKSTVSHLLSIGAKPFIIPSMGSHGGGVAEEQQAIIEAYGVTEEYTGARICSSMETDILGETEDGVPIHIDKLANKADFIVPIVRVKVHTDFDGPIESGFCKMLSIGIGKHNGCSRIHQEGFPAFADLLPRIAAQMIEKKNVPFGVGIIENAHEHVHTIEAVRGCDMLKREPELLALSKSLMPGLCFDHIDVLVVEQIGKDISGAGMDPNVIGRTAAGKSPWFKGPSITRIVVNRLSEGTHGNAIGMGLADYTTKALYNTIDPVSTYANCIASGSPEASRIPVVLDTEEEALLAAIQTCPKINLNTAKVVKIRDTLHLTDIQVSESLLPWCKKDGRFTIPEE